MCPFVPDASSSGKATGKSVATSRSISRPARPACHAPAAPRCLNNMNWTMPDNSFNVLLYPNCTGLWCMRMAACAWRQDALIASSHGRAAIACSAQAGVTRHAGRRDGLLRATVHSSRRPLMGPSSIRPGPRPSARSMLARARPAALTWPIPLGWGPPASIGPSGQLVSLCS